MVNIDGRRHYKLPNSELAVSMTTMLSDMSDKKHLDRWKKRVGEAEAAKITQSASTHGTGYHAIMEDYLNNRLNVESLTREELDTFKMSKSMVDRIDNILFVEQSLFSQKYRIAGTVDVCAEFDKVPSIIDHKTSLRPKKKEWIYNYFLQKTGYALMLEELTGIRIEQIVTLISIREQSEPPQIFVEKTETYRAPLIALIEAYHAKHHVSKI